MVVYKKPLRQDWNNASSICRILLAIMLTTGFLSMWMSNTATTAMMLPIVEAILIELIRDKRHRTPNTINSSGSRNSSSRETIFNDPQSNKIQERTRKIIFL